MTDQELMAMYQRRDPEAAAAMQRQYGPYCADIVRRILTDSRDAEECLNDVWLRVWQALQRQQPRYLKGWLGAVARNCAITRYHRMADQAHWLEQSAAELADTLADSSAEQLEGKALGESISAFLLAQDEDWRIAFVRRYWYGDTVAQAARHMGWSVSKTKSVLFRMRIRLKEYLTKEGFFHGEQVSH